MGTTIYADANTGAAIISLDGTTVASNSVNTIQLTATEVLGAPQTEADLNAIPAIVSCGAVDANLSVSEVAVNVTGYDYTCRHMGEDGTATETEVVEVVVLPESWVPKMNMDKWTRLCYEQQRHVWEPWPHWYSIDGIDPDTVTGGYNSGTIDFPVGYYCSEIFAVGPRKYENFHKIDSRRTNTMIEDIQLIYRKSVSNGYSEWDKWKHYLSVDAEDDPIVWHANGKYEFSSYPTIDGKQVPMCPAPSDPIGITDVPYVTIDQQLVLSDKFSLTPIWKGNTLMLYYFIPQESYVHEVEFLVDGTILNKLSLSNLAEAKGWIDLGAFNRRKPFNVEVKKYNLTERGMRTWKGRSFIGRYEFEVSQPMVRSDNFSLEINKSGTKFNIKVRGEALAALYKPSSIESAFQTSLDPASHWFQSIQEKRLILRLHVEKIVKGNLLPVGNVIINPIASAGSEISGVCNFDSNLAFRAAGVDELGSFYQFIYDPFAGNMGLMNSENAEETYIFRIAEWNIAIEHGLRTGEGIAWMVEDNPRWRYDTWDEEHPVKKWLGLSPVDPQDDSVSRCVTEAKGANCNIVEFNDVDRPSESGSAFNENVVVLDDWEWKVIYSDVLAANSSAYLFWPYLSFRIKMDPSLKYNFKGAMLTAQLMKVQASGLQTVSSGDQEFTTMTNELLPWGASFEIARFDHWSDVLDVRDFNSFQLSHWMWYQSLQPQDTNPEEDVGELPVLEKLDNIILPQDGVVLTEEQYTLYIRFLKEIAQLASERTREQVLIEYKLVVWSQNFDPWGFPDDTPHVFYLKDHGLYDQGQYMPFLYDIIEQPSDNIAYLEGSSRQITDLAETFPRIGKNDDNTSGGTTGYDGDGTRNLRFPTIDKETFNSGDGADTISGTGQSGSYVAKEGE